MDLKSLTTFLAIVDHQSFARAGDALHLSPSAVSLHVKLLEQALGVALFDRRTRPPRLTLEGRRLIGDARRLVTAWQRLSDVFKDGAGQGPLEIGAIPTLVSGILPVALRRLRDDHPGLNIRLTTGLSHELETLLVNGRLDAALVAEPEELRAELPWRPFCSEGLVAIMPAGSGCESDAQALTSFPFIRFKRYAWAERLIHDELRRRGIVVQATMEVDTLEGIVSLVASGLGVSVVPHRKLRQPFPAGVEHLPFGDPQVSRSLGMMQREHPANAHLVSRIFDELVGVSHDPGA